MEEMLAESRLKVALEEAPVVSKLKVALRGICGEVSVAGAVQVCEDGKSTVMLGALAMEGEGREDSWEAEGISMVVFSGWAGDKAGIIQSFSDGRL